MANANAQNQYFGQDGFGGSAANAGAQAFESHGPLGGFGAAASNAQSQGFNVGPNGITVSSFNAQTKVFFIYFDDLSAGICWTVGRTDVQSSQWSNSKSYIRQFSVFWTRWKTNSFSWKFHCFFLKILLKTMRLKKRGKAIKSVLFSLWLSS